MFLWSQLARRFNQALPSRKKTPFQQLAFLSLPFHHWSADQSAKSRWTIHSNSPLWLSWTDQQALEGKIRPFTPIVDYFKCYQSFSHLACRLDGNCSTHFRLITCVILLKTLESLVYGTPWCSSHLYGQLHCCQSTVARYLWYWGRLDFNLQYFVGSIDPWEF